MRITIYHNPGCSKSRQTLELIRETGAEPEIVNYLDTPPTTEEIETFLNQLQMDPRDAMRRKELPYKENNLGAPGVPREKLIAAMAEHPILIERPIVITDKGARICRPPELVHEVL